jgi:hypothetical protein
MGEAGKSVPMSIRVTARQYEILGLLARKFTAQNRDGSPFSPEVSPVEALRMCIMMTAYAEELIELNDEPSSSFELPGKDRKKTTASKKPKRK